MIIFCNSTSFLTVGLCGSGLRYELQAVSLAACTCLEPLEVVATPCFFASILTRCFVRNGKTEGFGLVSFHLDVACVGAAAVNDSFLAGVDHLDAATTVASGCKRRGPRYEF